jgi:microcompartment protein CcmK/EutM
MLMGKVVGTVVSTRKDEEIVGLKFLIVKQIDLNCQEQSSIVVAADAVGAGVGEVVLYAQGSSARQTVLTKDRPVDATIMAIVDNFEVNGEFRFIKVPPAKPAVE